MNEDQQTQVALWRVGVLGPLVSAHLEHGDLRQLCKEASCRTYELPDGRRVRVKARTIESWHYQYKRGGLEALKPQGRSDAGRSRAIEPELAELIVQAKQEKPRRSIRRIIRMLERAGKVEVGQLKKSTVHRLLASRGLSKRPRRYATDERRAYRHAHAGDMWMGDVMHGPRVIAEGGRIRKAYLHAFIDSAARFVPSCAFRLGEKAADFEAVLKQGILKHGLPLVLYVDRGAAQTSDSLRLICAELGIRLLHCRPYDAPAKGGVERWFRTYRAEVLDELPDEPLPLAELNSLTWSWLSAEYHRRVHSGTSRIPLNHWLEEADRLRPAPGGDRLDQVFLHRARRKVHKDSTVRFDGRLLEVRPELAGFWVELRFDPDDEERLPAVYVEGEFYCNTVQLDVVSNASRKRRRVSSITPADHSQAPSTGLEPLKLIADEHARRSRPPRNARDSQNDDEE